MINVLGEVTKHRRWDWTLDPGKSRSMLKDINLFYDLIMHICVCLGECIYVNAGIHRDKRRVSDPLELGL